MNKKPFVFGILLITVLIVAVAGWSLKGIINEIDFGATPEIENTTDVKTSAVLPSTEKVVIDNSFQLLQNFDETELADISSLTVGSGGKIDLEFGNNPLVEVFSDSENIRLQYNSGNLTILAGELTNGSDLQPEMYNIRLVVPQIDNIVMNQSSISGEINIPAINQESLRITTTSAGTVNAPNVVLNNLEIYNYGEGDVNLGGQTETLFAITQSSGNIFANNLDVTSGDVTIDGSGSIELGEVTTISQELNGLGNLDFQKK